MPCTVVNAVVAAALSLVLGVTWPPLGLVPLAFFMRVIYFRGYLIPGTPTLTKTYFSDRALRWLDKGSTQTHAGATVSAPESAADNNVDTEPSGEEIESGQLDGDGAPVAAFDAEVTLTSAGALELGENGDELHLALSFESAWDDEIAHTDETVARRWPARLVGVDEADVTLESHTRSRWFVAMTDDTTLGTWESNGVPVADVAVDSAFGGRLDDRDQLMVEQQSVLARGLRTYLNSCPTCGDGVRPDLETAEPYCWSWETFVVRCEDREARLLKVDTEALEPEAT